MAGEPMVDPDTSVPNSEEFREIAAIIAAYNHLVDRAKFILESYLHKPYTRVAEPGFARLRITETNHVEVTWPEVSSGYYNECSLEVQHAKIEPALFVKSVEEIEVLAREALVREQLRDNEKSERHRVMQAAMDRNNELAELARLKQKYETDERAEYTRLKAKYEPDPWGFNLIGGEHDDS